VLIRPAASRSRRWPPYVLPLPRALPARPCGGLRAENWRRSGLALAPSRSRQQFRAEMLLKRLKADTILPELDRWAKLIRQLGS